MWNEIKDFAAPELDVYARTSEVQLLRYYEPEPGIFIAESPKEPGQISYSHVHPSTSESPHTLSPCPRQGPSCRDPD